MIALGNTEITKAYLGNTEINKMYLGKDLVFGGSSPTPVLPYDSRVEYLQGTGNTTWINTNFIPTQNDLRVIVDAESTSTSDSIAYSINGSNPRLNINWYRKTSVYFRYRNYNTSFSITSARHTIENGPTMKVDDTTKATPSFSSSYTFVGNTKKIALFGMPNAAEPTSVTYPFIGKIYEFWIYYSDELKLHFIPVRKNGVGYMYDTVSGNLFGNSGTGTFSYGNDVTD